jgi:dTDP-4-dehydrorhamnose reductase
VSAQGASKEILVTGADGQLGQALVPVLKARGHEVVTPTYQQLDLTALDHIGDKLLSLRPAWVVNCAAYTQVDEAESEPELVLRINRDAVGQLTQAVGSYGGRLLQLSTDYVFDGHHCQPYREDDRASPLSVYGRSKWEGEELARAHRPDTIVVRTAWLYGCAGRNFVKTMLRLACEKEHLRVVDDQVGTPTWTGSLSQALADLLEQAPAGTFHYTDEGVASWYDLAVATVEEGRRIGFPVKAQRIEPVPTQAFPRPAPRPAFSLLSKSKIRPLLGFPIPHWRESLITVLRELKQCDNC